MTSGRGVGKALVLALLGTGGGVAWAQEGAPVLGPESAATATSYGPRPVFAGHPWLACGPERCLAAWETDGALWGTILDGAGAPRERAAFPLGSQAALGRTALLWTGSDFVLPALDRQGLATLRVSTDGRPGARVRVAAHPAGGVASWPVLARNGDRYLMAWREGMGAYDNGARTLRCQVLDATLAPVGSPAMLGNEASWPKPIWAVPAGDGFVVISFDRAYAVAPDGSLRAGPAPLPVAGSVRDVVAAGAEPVVSVAAGAAGGTLLRLGADLTARVTAPGVALALGWNGAHVLAWAGDPFGPSFRRPETVRYTADLRRADATTATIAVDDVRLALLAGRGDEFMLATYQDKGYLSPANGMYSLPLNAGGRPRATEATPISVTALVHAGAAVRPTPDGFVTAVRGGYFKVEVAGLDGEGRPAPGRGSLLLDATTFFDLALAAGAQGALPLWLTYDPGNVWTGTRLGAAGDRLDDPPLIFPGQTLPSRQVAATWNGRAYLVAVGGIVVRPVPPSGPPGAASVVRPKGYTAQLGLASAAGTGTSLLVWTDDTAASVMPLVRRGELAAVRLDGDGKPLDTTPVTLGAPWMNSAALSTLAVAAHDGQSFLVVWDAATVAADRAVTSELRAARVGMDGRALDAAPVVLRTATGGVPTTPGDFPGDPALSSLSAAFDGAVYWIAWQEKDRGVWTRRLAADGRVIDPQPIRLLDAPAAEPRLASRGDRRVLLLYTRYDDAPDVQSVRLKSRMIGGAGGPGAPDAGRADGGGGAVDAGGAADRPAMPGDAPPGNADAGATGDRPADAVSPATDGRAGTADVVAAGGAGGAGAAGGGGVGGAGGTGGAGGGAPASDGGTGASPRKGSSGCSCRIGDPAQRTSGNAVLVSVFVAALLASRRHWRRRHI